MKNELNTITIKATSQTELQQKIVAYADYDYMPTSEVKKNESNYSVTLKLQRNEKL